MLLLGVELSEEPLHTITVPKKVGGVVAEKVLLGQEMPEQDLTLHKDGTVEKLDQPSASEIA
jgi:hypothetical protein